MSKIEVGSKHYESSIYLSSINLTFGHPVRKIIWPNPKTLLAGFGERRFEPVRTDIGSPANHRFPGLNGIQNGFLPSPENVYNCCQSRLGT